MDSEKTEKIRETLNKAFSSKNRVKIFVAAGIIGIILILMSEAVPSNSSEKKESGIEQDCISYTEYTEALEEQTADLIGSVEGVGECKIMITLKNTRESVYAQNTQESSDEKSSSGEYEYVMYEGENGDAPVLIKQNYPEIQGIAVVCAGGDNVAVKEQVINCISSLYNLPASRISVSKINQKGDSNDR